jgi:hypothetical protein
VSRAHTLAARQRIAHGEEWELVLLELIKRFAHRAPQRTRLPSVERLSGPGVPLDHLDKYYLLRWRRTSGGAIAFTSSGLPHDGWIPLAEDSITRVDLQDLSMVTDLVPFGEVEAAVQ